MLLKLDPFMIGKSGPSREFLLSLIKKNKNKKKIMNEIKDNLNDNLLTFTKLTKLPLNRAEKPSC